MSRILLDTHVLLWAQYEPARLSARVSQAIQDPTNAVFFSAASIWEIAIKSALGRPDFTRDPLTIASVAQTAGFAELPVRSAAAALVARLPAHHKDPFDRLLVAQAMFETATLCTADPLLDRYSQFVQLFPWE